MQSPYRQSADPESLPYPALEDIACVPPEHGDDAGTGFGFCRLHLPLRDFCRICRASSGSGSGSQLLPLLPCRAASCLFGRFFSQPFDQPDPDGTGETAGRRRRQTFIVDRGDQRVDRQRRFFRGSLQHIPEKRLQTDRGLMPRYGDAALDRRVVRRPVSHHQYICCPPLIDNVDPVMKPAFSLVRNSTPRAISSAWPRRPIGIWATIFSITLSGIVASISVAI